MGHTESIQDFIGTHQLIHDQFAEAQQPLSELDKCHHFREALKSLTHIHHAIDSYLVTHPLVGQQLYRELTPMFFNKRLTSLPRQRQWDMRPMHLHQQTLKRSHRPSPHSFNLQHLPPSSTPLSSRPLPTVETDEIDPPQKRSLPPTIGRTASIMGTIATMVSTADTCQPMPSPPTNEPLPRTAHSQAPPVTASDLQERLECFHVLFRHSVT